MLQQSLHSHGVEAVFKSVSAGSHDSESARGKAGENGMLFKGVVLSYGYQLVVAQRKVGGSTLASRATCRSVLEQDTEPHVAYRCIHRCMCVCECLEKHVVMYALKTCCMSVCEWVNVVCSVRSALSGQLD